MFNLFSVFSVFASVGLINFSRCFVRLKHAKAQLWSSFIHHYKPIHMPIDLLSSNLCVIIKHLMM